MVEVIGMLPSCGKREVLGDFPSLRVILRSRSPKPVLPFSPVKQKGRERKGPQKSSRKFVSENGRFRAQISL